MPNNQTAESTTWMTNFHFSQELRSFYMNGLLSGGLHAGIYNANLSLVADSGDDPGISLYIKKGTTLVFSNGYKNIYAPLNARPDATNFSYLYERDFSQVGSYLIKSVALKDINVSLVSLSKSGSTSEVNRDLANKILGPNRKKNYFLIAKMKYNSEDKVEEGWQDPQFFLFEGNENYKNPNDPGNSDDLYYKSLIGGGGADGVFSEIPDGSKGFKGHEDSLKNVAWLCCGMIRENNNSIASYISAAGSPTWMTDKKYNAADLWTRNVTFTARGLEEYRYSLSKSNSLPKPSFYISSMVDPESESSTIENGLFLDIDKVRAGNSIFTKKANFRKIYGIGTGNGERSLKKYTFEEFKKAKDFSFSVSESDIENFNTKELKNDKEAKLLVDAVFLGLETDISNKEISSSAEDTFLKNLLEKKDSNANLISQRFLIYFPESMRKNMNLNPKFDSENQWYEYSTSNNQAGVLNNMLHPDYQSFDNTDASLSKKYIVPLDLSTANINRLLSIVENTNIIPKIISYMRSQRVIPSNVGAMVPVCISFRGWENVEGEIKSMDDYSTLNEVYPANVLSFFDLDSNTITANTVPVELEDIFTVLPVI